MGFLAAHRGLSLGAYRPVIKLLLFFAAFFHAAGFAVAEPMPLGPETEKSVPDSLVYFSPQNQGHILLVEKAHQKAYLYDIQNLDGPLRVYPCSTGENRGPKTQKNDKKTPEGIYFITNSFLRKDLTPIYGDRAFPLDYPNVRDRKLARKGYGIWIHGTNEVLKPRDTNGCIVFTNEDIRDLAGYINKRHTPVIITQEIHFVEKEQLFRERTQIRSLIEDWTHAWKGGHIDRYMFFYAKDFTGQGRTRLQWRAHKQRLSDSYGGVNISIDNLQILKEGGIALAKFDQTYRADRFRSFGEKRLYLQQRSPEWKIVDEFFERKDLPSPTKGPSRNQTADRNLAAGLGEKRP
jgi:murein L,D-transpeptidase YafK